MPLAVPAARRPIHTRRITLEGFRREDGLWDIEGVLTDSKSDDFPGRCRGRIPAGEPIHHMHVRVTVDDALRVHAVEAVTVQAPFPMCGDIAPAFAALAGLSLTAGFMRDVRARFGGTKGCTHMVELLGAIATAAFQTVYPALSLEREESGPPPMLDTCHAFAADGALVAREWPQYAHSRTET